MTWKTLEVRTDGRGVVNVALNTPEKRNVLSPQMIAELTEMAGTIGHDSGTRVIVLSGAGTTFCAGADLNWIPDYGRGTPLDAAQQFGTQQENVITWLRERGARTADHPE